MVEALERVRDESASATLASECSTTTSEPSAESQSSQMPYGWSSSEPAVDAEESGTVERSWGRCGCGISASRSSTSWSVGHGCSGYVHGTSSPPLRMSTDIGSPEMEPCDEDTGENVGDGTRAKGADVLAGSGGTTGASCLFCGTHAENGRMSRATNVLIRGAVFFVRILRMAMSMTTQGWASACGRWRWCAACVFC